MSTLDDPSQLTGVLPSNTPDQHKKRKNNAATGASAAGVRAFTAQTVAFYFRTPVKAFFRTRVDYLAYARALSPDTKGRWSWRSTTPGLLAHAVKVSGWKFLGENVLPPLLANVTVGAILYTSYLQILSQLHEPSSEPRQKMVYPPPPPVDTFSAGFMAGGIQSLVAAPLDAVQIRSGREEFDVRTSMYKYGKHKLREIGFRGIFAGWGLSFVKDSLSAGLFFSTFEYVKAQGYYKFIKYYYGGMDFRMLNMLVSVRGTHDVSDDKTPVIKPHYALEPMFLGLAGVAATITQQAILFPMTKIQQLHYNRLDGLDREAKELMARPSRGQMLIAYQKAYKKTYKELVEKSRGKAMRTWLMRGFWWNTLRQAPSTSAGLIIFELVRRRYGSGDEPVKIVEDGYEILLS